MNTNLPYSIDGKKYDEFDTMEKVEFHLSQYEVPFQTTTEEALSKLKARIAREETSMRVEPNTSMRLIYTISSIAASIALLVGVWFFALRNPNTEVFANRGEHTEYVLPEGTEVSLNAESKLAFVKRDFEKNRTVKLEGEAFFNVKKGSTFTIETPQGEIKILGTSFNVVARSNAFKVSCLTGKVQVISGKNKVTITPGQSSELVNNSLKMYSDSNINRVTNWRIGEFYYEYSPLNSIFEEIERQYNVTFVTSNIDQKYFTGSFSNKNLVDALDIVCIPMGLSYEIGSNGKIYIKQSSN